ncbi:ferrous iron transport protein B [bacterium]|nr:MAG: ferrous iron transport protein B [bacterium]
MSNCHCSAVEELFPGGQKKLVLVGNPNVGKSVFFGAWSGLYVEVSNFPGTTVEVMGGKAGSWSVYDTPGVYGVGSFNDEERVARDVILGADVVVNVVDSTHLERDLFLTLQVLDMGIPMVVALNFTDEAKANGIEIDLPALTRELGVEVIPCAAVQGKGIAEVLEAVERAVPGHPTPEVEKRVTALLDRIDMRPEALMVAEGDEVVALRHGVHLSGGEEGREAIYILRRERVNKLVDEVVKRPHGKGRVRDFIGRMCLEPVSGLLILAIMLLAAYQVVGVFVAGDIVAVTEGKIMQGLYEPWVIGTVSRWVSPESFLGAILIGEFGLFTMTVTYLFGLLLPLVAGFYVTLSLLEDSGYLPRLAAFVDRMMNGIGLNGRAIIPIILGFGCVQLGTITTRILGSHRERTIATAILNFVIPCSAQIGVITGMLAAIGGVYTAVYGASIFLCLVIVGTVMGKVVPGETTELLIDLPPMRIPRLGNIARKTVMRTFFFMKEALPWFAAGALGVSILLRTGVLAAWQTALSPLTQGWLGLPGEASTAFVMGMVRRDFGAAGLTSLSLSPWQTVVALVTMTLFVPCIASLMVLFKERGMKQGMYIWVSSWIIAFIAGGILARIVL